MITKRLFSDYFDTIDGILETSGKVAVLFDARKFKIQYVNDAFTKFFNVSKEVAYDKFVYDFVPYSKDDLIDIIVGIINNVKYKNQLKTIKDKHATVDIIRIASPGLSDDIFGLFFEIADEAKIENATYKSTVENLNNLIDVLTEVYKKMYLVDLSNKNVVIYKLTKKKISINKMVYEKKVDTSLFKKFCTYVPDSEKEKVFDFINLDTIKERMKHESKLNLEFESTFDGWVRIGFIACGRNMFGEIQSVIFTYRPINDVKKKELSMQNAVKEAIDASEVAKSIRSEFLSKVREDIITPLTSIVAMASLAKTSVNDSDSSVTTALSKIIDASQKLTKTFSEIVDMSKIEAGNVKFNREEIDLGELFTKLINSQRKEILAKNHKITIRNSNVEHEFIYGDKIKIQQIFNAILDNAIRYTQPYGEIEITINEKKIEGDNKIGEYSITFQDNGIGMSEDFVKKAIEPFERENRPQVQLYNGDGLGLSIANSYLQKMGGRLKIKSDLASGTKVTVTLYAEILNKDYLHFNNCENTRLLLVSNNASQVSDVMATLSSMNIKAHSASNERSAIMQLKEAEKKGIKFSYIFCTWMTPTMKGPEVIKKIRESVPFELPPVVFTHYELENIMEKGKEVGVHTYASLPLFRNRIHKVLNELSGNTKENDRKALVRQDKVLKGKKVLIVEDNLLNREILNDFLQMYGIDIYEARDGKEALDMFLKSDEYFYDLILMDIQMPVMNGYESTMSIRSSGREDGKRIPIIAMSASSFADDINASLIAGMNEHVAKPLNFSSLHNSIEKWFSGDYATRKNLELKAKSDSFTDVLNKMATFECIHKYVTKDTVPLSAMLILDLDHLKMVNDRYGHKEGDQVIYDTTQIIIKSFRENDIIGRFGGDEFIIFMKDIGTKEVASKRANDLIKEIEKNFKVRYSDLNLTACVGLAYVNKPMDEDTIFVNADHALYQAKNNGRNQVVTIDAE